MTKKNELAILIGGRMIQIFIMLAAIKISTTVLNPNEIGKLYLLISIGTFFSLFLINPFGQYINRKTHEWHDNRLILNKFFNYNLYVIAVCIFSIVIVIIFKKSGIAQSIDLSWLIVLIPLYIYCYTWNYTIIPMINLLEHRVAFVIFSNLTLLAYLLFSCFLVFYYSQSGALWFSGQIIGCGIVSLIALIFFTQNFQDKFNLKSALQDINRQNTKQILKFAMPLSVGVLFLWLQTQSYRVTIEKYISADFLGYFGVGIGIAIAISSSMETIVTQFLYPTIYKNMNNGKFKNLFVDTTNYIITIYFLLAILVSFVAKYLITILTAEQYHSSFVYIIFGIWVEFFRMSANLLSLSAHSKMKTNTLIVPYAIGGIFILVGTYFATQFVNYHLTIPIVLIIGGCLTFIQMFVHMNRLEAIKIEYKNFLKAGLYGIVFAIACLFYDFSSNIFIAILMTAVSGIYFLFIVYRFSKKYGGFFE